MEFKQILEEPRLSALFCYLAMRVSNSLFNHLRNCLAEDKLSWSDFLHLPLKTRILKFSFLSGEANRKLDKALNQPQIIVNLLQRIQEERIFSLSPAEKNYPPRITRELGLEAPPFLFCKGNFGCLKKKNIAIVGTRRPSSFGINATQSYTALLARQGINIVSGGAMGIDTAAHISALSAGGATTIVLPQGIFRFKAQSALLPLIDWKRTLIVSSFPPDEPFQKRHAVFRNSIVAAIADSVIVPETPLRSGTAYVIRHILAHRRPLFTILYNKPEPLSASGNRSLVSAGAIPLPPKIDSAEKILRKLLQTIQR